MARLGWSAGGLEAHWALQLVVGGAFGGVVVVVSQWMVRAFEPIRALNDELAELLPPLSNGDAAIAAACSGVAEEVFFRGAMQHAWGLWPTALVFTVLHGFFHPRLLAWMAFAAFCGVVFGYAALWFGSILAPLCAHVVINFLNLRFMSQRKTASA